MSVSGGEVSCTWLSGKGNELTHHAGIVVVKEGKFYLSELEPQTLTDIKMRRGGEDLGDGGEYFPIKRLSTGGFGMVTTIQNVPEDRLGFSWWKLRRSVD